MRISRQESRDFIQGSLYVRDRRGPQTSYQIHVYKSQFLLHDFIFQTIIQFYENTPAMAFNNNLNNTTVCSDIKSLCPIS